MYMLGGGVEQSEGEGDGLVGGGEHPKVEGVVGAEQPLLR